MSMRSTIVAIFILFSVSLSSQVTNSVLANGNWFKFSVDTTGVFRIDRSLLQQIGVSPDNVDPRKIHIYGNGGNPLPEVNADFRYEDLQENAIYIEGESDGSFDANDFILFYAKGPHDWLVDPATGIVEHRQNIYSDKAYYFITVDNNDGKRIQSSITIPDPSVIQITTFDDYIFHEQETINLFAAGRRWFGEDFNVENERSFDIPFPNAVVGEDINVRVAAGVASSTQSFMQVSANAQDLFSFTFAASNDLNLGSYLERLATLSNSSNSVNITISYNNVGNPSARAYLDYIEVIGKKNLIANDFQFGFRSFEAANTAGVVEYQIQNAQNILQLWDVTDPINVASVANESTGNFSFKANGGELREYVALNSNDFYIPEAISNPRVENQNLHALQDINYLLITNEELAPQAQRLADYHEQNSGLTTQIVIVDDIYNEFSSGSSDITGIRDFIKYIYDNNTTPDRKLQFVCFFGDGSYDYKDRISNNNNVVPVYLSVESFNLASSYVTDDYYGMMDDNEGDMSVIHTIDIATGRIPVSTIDQATNAVDKILSYYQQEAIGDWRNTITLVADDIDENSDINIQSGVERIADDIKDSKPIFNVNKIYADSFVQQNSSGGERYPNVKDAITTAIERGTLIFDYFGHGGEDGFASERFLDVPQVQSFQNENTLPLFITVTCEFSRFDNPSRITAGELTFLNTDGGAASMITTTREVFISTGQNFNEQLMAILLEFNGEDLTIGQSLAKAKNDYVGSNEFQKYFIYHFGDPAKKLAIPEPNVRITRMNGVNITQSLDTLKALSRVNFEGVVTDNLDNVLTNFNGKLSTTVFDKPIDKATLDNDNFGVILNFDSRESKLFRGQSTVQNGNFNFEFIVPRDVRIAFGNGKLSFYADNGESDKSGFNSDIIVGGINENAPSDTTGPEIQLFMNDESFIDGGNTNTSPNLIASLADPSGINTSVTAVDHDIVAILDGDESNPIILNDFYTTELDDFTKGKVVYRLRDLAVGPHTLKLKAWDTYNNSSESMINFVVVSDATLTLDNVLNYPNPFVNYTEFWFNHNKPNESLEVQVQIFTISGKLIKTINQQVTTTGNLSRNIAWNGLDDFGNKIGKGVYVYKLKVKSTVSNISAEKYEKLVIL